MAKTRSAGDLYHRYAFERRVDADRGDGVKVGAFVEQFQCRAGVINLRGGETILAGRLQGQHSQVVFIRSSQAARLASTEWRARDVRSGVVFNIREVTLSDDRMWLDFLCQSGVASG